LSCRKSHYAIIASLAAVYTVKRRAASLLVWLTFWHLCGWPPMTNGADAQTAFDSGMFVADGFSRFAKVNDPAGLAAVLVMSEQYMVARNLRWFEYPLLVAPLLSSAA
jgi:NADH-quinone oxidoreductase subunit N